MSELKFVLIGVSQTNCSMHIKGYTHIFDLVIHKQTTKESSVPVVYGTRPNNIQHACAQVHKLA